MDIGEMTVDQIMNELSERCPNFIFIATIPDDNEKCDLYSSWSGNRHWMVGALEVMRDRIKGVLLSEPSDD